MEDLFYLLYCRVQHLLHHCIIQDVTDHVGSTESIDSSKWGRCSSDFSLLFFLILHSFFSFSKENLLTCNLVCNCLAMNEIKTVCLATKEKEISSHLLKALRYKFETKLIMRWIAECLRLNYLRLCMQKI